MHEITKLKSVTLTSFFLLTAAAPVRYKDYIFYFMYYTKNSIWVGFKMFLCLIFNLMKIIRWVFMKLLGGWKILGSKKKKIISGVLCIKGCIKLKNLNSKKYKEKKIKVIEKY